MAASASIPAPQGATATAPNNINNTESDLVRQRLKYIENFIVQRNLSRRNWMLERIRSMLNSLERGSVITLSYIKDNQIDEAMLTIFAHPEHEFPEDVKQRAEALYHKWEAANRRATEGAAGEGEEEEKEEEEKEEEEKEEEEKEEEEEEEDDDDDAPRPPQSHPIWGLNGIMHGIMPIVDGKTKNFKRDERYPKRPAISGAGRLQLGDWYAYQLVALFKGAHGSSQGGVAGDHTYCAFSIVLSGKYKDVDDDQGDTIYYSGPGSHENTNPNILPSSQGTGYLQRSIATGNVVRVLRRANNSYLAPPVGLRYDGLYRVVRQEQQPRHNAKGGIYTRYVGQRCPQQESLASIRARSPTAQQIRDYEKVWDLY